MDDARLVKVSKYLSRHLRHDPGRLGLQLDRGGWVRVDDLLRACNRHGLPLSRAELAEVVERNDKKRFSLDATGSRIRANQGHSVDVDLDLEPVSPPAELFHGTSTRAVDSILRTGISRMGRHHVHLSADADTARKVGARHGKPVVLRVDAATMSEQGAVFYRSENGVWLTESVPPQFLALL